MTYDPIKSYCIFNAAFNNYAFRVCDSWTVHAGNNNKWKQWSMTRLVHYAFYYDQKVTEGMVYTIKYEPQMMLMGWTILFLSLGLQALLVIMQHPVWTS